MRGGRNRGKSLGRSWAGGMRWRTAAPGGRMWGRWSHPIPCPGAVQGPCPAAPPPGSRQGEAHDAALVQPRHAARDAEQRRQHRALQRGRGGGAYAYEVGGAVQRGAPRIPRLRSGRLRARARPPCSGISKAGGKRRRAGAAGAQPPRVGRPRPRPPAQAPRPRVRARPAARPRRTIRGTPPGPKKAPSSFSSTASCSVPPSQYNAGATSPPCAAPRAAAAGPRRRRRRGPPRRARRAA
jgi:hypothetical protein